MADERRPVEVEDEPASDPSADGDLFARFRLNLDPERFDQNLRELGATIRDTVQTHRFSKVRVTYRGRALLPDIPVAAFIAGEVAGFWWAGPLRVLVVHLGLGTFVDVTLVNEADDLIREGQALFVDGEVEAAEERYRKALKMRPNDPAALFALGSLLRVTGRRDEAVAALEQAARKVDHPDGKRATEVLERMQRGRRSL